METKRRIWMFFSGAAALAVGVLVYLLERGAANVYFLPDGLASIGEGAGVLGALGPRLPSFLHTYAFILISAALLTPLTRRPWLTCSFWCALEALLECGQHPGVAPWLAPFLPASFHGVPALEATKSFFLLGTFDLFDLLAIAAGGGAALGTILALRTDRREERVESDPPGMEPRDVKAAFPEISGVRPWGPYTVLGLGLFAAAFLTVVATSRNSSRAPLRDLWAWMAGSDTGDVDGVYGIQGTPDPLNTPGGRYGSAAWLDANDDLWIFGGLVGDGPGDVLRNDLWLLEGSTWTWISGSSTPDQWGVYGVRGVPDPGNVPGARRDCSYWTNSAGVFWLFGGWGFDEVGALGSLNDVWRFSGGEWTWIAGEPTANSPGSYGIQGVADPSNVPPGRARSACWVDGVGDVWVFGGDLGTGLLNDLWRFGGRNWMWVSGSSVPDQPGVYGSLGSPDPGNAPGARYGATSWGDSGVGLWLFGGAGYDELGAPGPLNDLWFHDGVDWAWMSGSTTASVAGVYGTRGIADPGNVPGSRFGSAAWVGLPGELWLFGGEGLDESGAVGILGDLWLFDGADWTWKRGSSSVSALGDYADPGRLSVANAPGARVFPAAARTSGGNFWLFGGLGYDSVTGPVSLNDAWMYPP